MSGLLESALSCAHQGSLVLPCEPHGKRPLTRAGLRDASSDPVTIAEWWLRWPDANVAVRTGRESRVVVLDVDGEVGAASLRQLERSYGELPRTRTVATPRDGRHFVFAHPGVEVRNSAGKLGPALDVRGDGGYVLVPPSIGANGSPYALVLDAEPAPMPSWLTGTPIPNAARPAGGGSTDLAALVRDGVPEGRRNDALTRLVGVLLRRYVEVDLAAELVAVVNETRCRPPLPGGEVDRLIESIAAREVQRRMGARR
jgi:hypothetical protein